jgi:hypothetical protein
MHAERPPPPRSGKINFEDHVMSHLNIGREVSFLVKAHLDVYNSLTRGHSGVNGTFASQMAALMSTEPRDSVGKEAY